MQDTEIIKTKTYAVSELDDHSSERDASSSYFLYIIIPVILLAVTLLGGIRLGATDSSFIFLKPALVCLVFAALTIVLYVRSGMIEIGGWLSEGRPMLQNASCVAMLLLLFTSTVQLFNSLLPEQGLTFWVVGFCFFWSIWNNLFADLEARRLLRSMVSLFGLAFIVKYLVLVNLTAAPDGNWLQRLIQDPGKEAFTWLLDLSTYSAGTGYIQFFTLSLYLLALFLLPRRIR